MTPTPEGLIVLVSLSAVFAARRAADILNLSRLKGGVPEGFRDVFDEAAYRKALDYARARLKFSMAEASWDLASTLAFWFAGGFAAWDRAVRTWGWGETASGLAYVGGLFFARDFLSLPFDLYSTFALEARFGFNRTAPRTFALDRLKAWGLTILLGGPLLAAVLLFFARAGSAAWLWAWGATALFGLILQFAAPTWILPLFNKFTPLPEGPLRSAIFALAGKLSYPLANVFVMDGSKRSSKTNAFFTGFGRHKRIALFDTLVDRHTVPELVGVMAHEIGHYKERHVLLGAALSILQQGVVFFLLSLFLRNEGLFRAFGLDAPSAGAGLALFGMVYAPLSFVLGIGLCALSRRHEFQADRYALRATGDPDSMVSALKKLAAANLAQLAPHPFYAALHYTHPPLPARIAAIRDAARAG